MSGVEQKIEPVEMAPVEAVIVEIKPPDITFDPNTGKVDKAVVGYIEEEGEGVRIVPVGKVTSEPATSMVKSPFTKDRTGLSIQVCGLVSKNIVFRSIVAHGHFEGRTHNRFVSYSEEDKQKIKEELERRAAQAVFNVLGIDIQPKPKPKRRGRFTEFLRSWASS